MDFRLDDDQLALQETISQFCRARYSLDGLAERSGGRLDRAGWTDLADLGVFSLMAAVSHGGTGLGVVEAAIVFEQLGYHLVPGPLVWSALAALVVEPAGHGEVVAGGTAGTVGPFFVEHPDDLDMVVALRRSGVFRIDRAELGAATRHDALDPHNAVGSFASLPPGTQVGDAGTAERLVRIGTVLCAAMQLGIAHAALDVAVGYSLEREQFGVPIGSFQALKHIMADMYVRVGLARSATYAAAGVLDDPVVGHTERSVSAAKLLAGEAATDNARASVQVLGGMGFTWDMAPNFLLKRAWVLDQAFGTPSEHALAIAASVGAEVA